MEISVFSEDINSQLWSYILSKNITNLHNIYQTYEWAILMKKCYGLTPSFIVAKDTGGRICGGLLYFKKTIFKNFYAYESQGGITIEQDQSTLLGSLIIKHFNDIKGNPLYISLRPELPLETQRIFRSQGFNPSPFYTFLLNVSNDEDIIWKSFHKNARNGIRKAQKCEIQIKEANKWDEWLEFYNLHILHSKKRKIAPKNVKFFRTLYDIFLPKEMAKLFISKKENILTGGMLFLNFSKVMTYYIGASNDIHKDQSSNDLLMWTAIKWGHESGYLTIDLGDTWPNPRSHLYSIHKFKEKWGGQLTECDFFIKGSIYRLGRSLVLDNKSIQNCYELLHMHKLI